MKTKRDFLRIGDLSVDELRGVLALARVLKDEAKGTRTGVLAGRAVAHDESAVAGFDRG